MTGTFENDEQVLLLYLADEVTPAERAEIDVRLVQDVALAAKLEHLSTMHFQIEQRLRELDKFSGTTMRRDVAARQVGREIRQRLARPKAEPPVAATERRHRMLPWLIPSGIAAAIVVGTIAWVHHQAMVNEFAYNRERSTQPIEPATIPSESEANVALLEQSFDMPGVDEVARADARRDVAREDDLSGYMLKLEAAH
jgi:hypothetical protein